jgi:hypothetical protein
MQSKMKWRPHRRLACASGAEEPAAGPPPSRRPHDLHSPSLTRKKGYFPCPSTGNRANTAGIFPVNYRSIRVLFAGNALPPTYK